MHDEIERKVHRLPRARRMLGVVEDFDDTSARVACEAPLSVLTAQHAVELFLDATPSDAVDVPQS